ncbi:hypothetical protein B0A54_11966 [Friedmanniomyces endolithicus]|uniref:Sterol uptake control protein 2 n=1 Tax=Friedmanniomyces endolithicus TaxID=329885 RepID=A0A4U0UQ77_9PEZI|nr:hypothetical protein B0A54_11966 [Friedmanniomyces endolithicus]
MAARHGAYAPLQHSLIQRALARPRWRPLQTPNSHPLLLKDVADLWQTYIPLQALTHPHLLHGLLAFSALNLADLHRGTPRAAHYLTICDKHQSVAIAALRDALANPSANITPEISASLFALAATLSISSMARSCAVANAQTALPRFFSVEEIAEAVILTKGMREVTGLTMGFVLDTPIGIMLTSHSMEDEAGVDPESARLPGAVRERFDALRGMLRARCTARTLPANPPLSSDSSAADHPGTLETCEKALEDLEEIYRNLRYFKRKGRLQNGHLWRWPAMVPLPFVHLLAARHPPTLIIVAHFAAATVCLRRAWFVRDWGEYALEGIARALEHDPGMSRWLEWPREQLGREMEGVLCDVDNRTC